MHCPTLDQLPAPPRGKSGWPWTVETSRGRSGLPRITIVTPSFNQSQFLEETLRSVLLQGYPDLEYIVVDGGSTDSSVGIIRKYEPWLARWVSGKDRGQADAIRKGFEWATGEIIGWVNSDDLYLPGSLMRLADGFVRKPQADVVYGNLYRIDADSRVLEEHRQTPFQRMGYLYGGFYLHQPSTLWRRELMRAVGGVNPEFSFDMDNDLFVRFALRGAPFRFERAFVACFRVHPESKTSRILHVSKAENDRIRDTYLDFGYNSFRGRLARNVAKARRLFWYTVQGDLPWLVRRGWLKATGPRKN